MVARASISAHPPELPLVASVSPEVAAVPAVVLASVPAVALVLAVSSVASDVLPSVVNGAVVAEVPGPAVVSSLAVVPMLCVVLSSPQPSSGHP